MSYGKAGGGDCGSGNGKGLRKEERGGEDGRQGVQEEAAVQAASEENSHSGEQKVAPPA